ncbi:MAG: class B sortase [Clostridia bacterium]|nr:class B sortase [Clostridia bacterium]
MYRDVLRILNGLLSAVEALLLIVCLLYAGYSLWDNQQIYTSVSSLQNELLAFKPTATENDEETGPSFEELQAINPDVCAWLTMDGTRIDYPILRANNNTYYLSYDVYRKFSLAGSLFLDSRNAFTVSDAYNLIHGHHMNQGRMFGDLDLYKREEFFRENATGSLITPETAYQLDVIACLNVNSTDDVIFAPQRWLEDAEAVLDYTERNATYLHADTLALARTSGAPLLCLATCADGSNRTIVLCMMTRAEGGAAQ